MKKVAIILSGCGNRDGSELQETLSLMLALDSRGVAYQCFAPQGQFAVVSYLDNGGETGEHRDLFAEAARIARGNLQLLSAYSAAAYDALLLPGGMGAARNLSTYAFDGEHMTVLPVVERAIKETYRAGKPIGAVCIAPIVLAKVLGPMHVRLTLGMENAAMHVAEKLGARVEECAATAVVVDTEHRVVTSPAYMVATRISEIFSGADQLVESLLRLEER